jgi:hypothetical protein
MKLNNNIMMKHQVDNISVKTIFFNKKKRTIHLFLCSLEPLSPIYIRAPNPSIILRSDLHRLRAQLTARPPGNNFYLIFS